MVVEDDGTVIDTVSTSLLDGEPAEDDTQPKGIKGLIALLFYFILVFTTTYY